MAWLLTTFLVRPLVWLLTHTIYRLRVIGRDRLPAEPVLLVCNHVSYIDWLLVRAAARRPVRFIVWAGHTKTPFVRLLYRWTRAIPVDGHAGPRAIVGALRTASEALKADETVCIFAEGKLTRSGFMLPFHRGFERITKDAPAPIVPVCLHHVWGSIFSFRHGKVFWKWPERIPYPVTVGFGPPLPPDSTAHRVRQAIQELSAQCAIATSDESRPVHRQFVRVASRRPFRPCLIDTRGEQPKTLSYAKALTGAICVADWLRPQLGDARMVGVWLPPSVGGVLANIAAAFLGKTAVNLNYTAGPDSVASAARQCDLRAVVTSKLFRHRVPLDLGPDIQVIDLEDATRAITSVKRTLTFLQVLLLPGWVLERCVLRLGKHTLDHIATVIFSSGSTGEPKGVMLSQRNVAANVESMVQAVDLTADDRLFGILPFFHSFGYTVTLWGPLQVGALGVYHADPRQAKEVGEICRKTKPTVLLATATFLRFYLKRSLPGDFDSLRLLVCGAEKLPVSLAKEFHEKFGVLPTEGYGCTELSPVVSANIPDIEINGVKQVCNKFGTIGQPLPGVAVRVAHPETGEPMPPDEEGILMVTGANVMAGYLGKPELTREKVRDGWYDTGDMGKIDADGFITITGRLSRFAKTGGEMVPLERVEEELHHAAGTNDRLFAVAAVPDEKRGERVVVLHLPLEGITVREVLERLSKSGLPNLWQPGERDFYLIDEMPVLGSGKLDLRRLGEMAKTVAR